MKKHVRNYLIFSFALSYLCFGVLAYLQMPFTEVTKHVYSVLLLGVGFLSPLLAAIYVYVSFEEELGGIAGLLENLKYVSNKQNVALIPIFILVHYGLGVLMKNVGVVGGVGDFFLYLPLMLLLLGTHEIGWKTIVHPHFEEEKGFWKANIITGLFWSLWFLPLLFIPGFVILPEYFTQFAVFLVGITMLSTTIYKLSGSLAYSGIFVGVLFAITPVIAFRQSMLLIPIALGEAIVSFLFLDAGKEKARANG